MGSINAQQVAMKVSGNIRKGKKVVLAEIIKEVGYSPSIADSPSLVTNTQSYKTALALETKPLLEQLEQHRQKILNELATRKLNKEEYRTLIGSLDIITRNTQLLSGGATSRNVLVLPSEVMERNTITQSDDVNITPSPVKEDDNYK
jgi:hypothetical protein